MKAMLRLAAVATAAALALSACGSDDEEDTDSGDVAASDAPTIGVAYDLGGRGDGGFNDLAYAGAEAAATAAGGEVTESTAKETDTDADRAARLELLAESGANPIIAVGYLYATALGEVAPKYPDTWFGIVDDASVEQPNVAGLTFAANQGSFLVGVAAALETTTKKVGFIGGVDTELINEFEAGFLAGVKAAAPDVEVSSAYLTQPPDFAGFNDPAKGKESAGGLYDAGADIIFAAAGGSNAGVFDAANGAGMKAIGVDSDQYNTTAAPLNSVIMTSMLKKVDVGVETFIASVLDGTVTAGVTMFDLSSDGVGYSTSGDFLKPETITAIDDFAAQIKAGEIEVPTTVE